VLHFVVYDSPVTQGSAKAVVSKSTNQPIYKPAHEKELGTWRDAVKKAAREAIEATDGGYPLEGPVVLAVTFTLYKPKNKPKTKPSWPEGTRQDLDKLLRAVMDAMTAAGVWKDDGQVVELTRLYKSYPLSGMHGHGTADLSLGPGAGAMYCLSGTSCDVLTSPGAVIRVAPMTEVPVTLRAEAI
jgi:Holliday junction resolvase RusA-like endonuclease